YTSPHIRDYTERIAVSGGNIPGGKFAGIIEELKPSILSHEPRITFFEAITTAAIYHFLEQNTTVNVLEIGLGGRLDATNATTPELSVITRIGYDHTQTLGKTLLSIAREKCGILRHEKPAVVGPQRPRARSAIVKSADEIGARPFCWGRDFTAELNRQSDKGLEGRYKGIRLQTDFRLHLLGAHQIENAATAIAASEVMLTDMDAKTIAEGLENVRLDARIEVVGKKPLIIVDMSHNAESAVTLSKALKEHFSGHPGRVLLIGISRHKNRSAILKTLSPFFTEIYVTRAGFARAEPSRRVLNTCAKYHSHCIEIPSVSQALSEIIPRLKQDDLLVVTGSAYIAGEALDRLDTRKRTDVC
ncbi:hypothetical protein GF359_03595, partial [candidate division WOR-3 bacterium]|nr:hypothetical protein [candidate division WOR-3 bacterium]MBD3364279.1 hypothetical protein [candidate division WOR-3 bacterium]